ncbi:MAG: GNAT family N-acetyltransferase [Candidatus Omnitrophica bacterium]|nr:GNAT family N-acetyltransferase [Candidatus Omnitrophota bacterium]
MEDIVIRKYKRKDRQVVRDIAWETAFMGKPASVFFSDREIFSDFLTLYFTDYEPESCFVAESKGNVVGYLIGAEDEAKLKKIFIFKIIPMLFIKAITRGVLLKKKDSEYLKNCFNGFLNGEFRSPDFSEDYPAILHINIMESFRKLGIGSKLISSFLEYSTVKKIKGVHLSTMSEEGGKFFKNNGFNLVYSAPRSYFKHILSKDIIVCIYGKKLASQ